VQLRHALGKDAHAPGFYVHLDPDEIFYGGGVWGPPPPQFLQIGEAIRDKGAAWKKATTGPAFDKRFGALRGDALTRPPRGLDGDHPLIDDIKSKVFFAMAEGKPGLKANRRRRKSGLSAMTL